VEKLADQRPNNVDSTLGAISRPVAVYTSTTRRTGVVAGGEPLPQIAPLGLHHGPTDWAIA